MADGNGVLAELEAHPAISGAVLVVVALLVGYSLIKNKSGATATTAATATPAYLVGQNTFSTINQASPNGTSDTPVSGPAPIRIATPILAGVLPSSSPVRATAPISIIKHKGARIWDQRYLIKRGDTISGVASGVQNYMRRYQGMPATVGVSGIDLQAHNVGRPFAPGQTWTTPRWDSHVN